MDATEATPPTRRLWGDVFGGFAGLIGMIALAHGIVSLHQAYRLWRDEQRFHQEGAVAIARVVAKTQQEIQIDGEGPTTHYRLHYEYADATGKAHRANKLVPRHVWEKSAAGGELPPVEYARSEPTLHRPAATDGQWRSGVWAGVLFLGVALGGLGWSYRLARSDPMT